MIFETRCGSPAPALLPERSLTAGVTARPQSHRSSSPHGAGHVAELTTALGVAGPYCCSGKGGCHGQLAHGGTRMATPAPATTPQHPVRLSAWLRFLAPFGALLPRSVPTLRQRSRVAPGDGVGLDLWLSLQRFAPCRPQLRHRIIEVGKDL